MCAHMCVHVFIGLSMRPKSTSMCKNPGEELRRAKKERKERRAGGEESCRQVEDGPERHQDCKT